MLQLQNFASEGGFWILVAVISVVVLGSAVYFRRPLEGEPARQRLTLGQIGSFLSCIVNRGRNVVDVRQHD